MTSRVRAFGYVAARIQSQVNPRRATSAATPSALLPKYLLRSVRSCPSIVKFALIAVCVIGMIASIVGCGQKTTDKLKIVATTTHMESALKEVGGDHIDVRVLISPGGCPGHYDIRPDDVQALAQSAALFVHGYERFVPQLLDSVGKPGPQVCEVGIEDNWLVPEVYKQAIGEVARLLSEIDPDHADEYERHREQALDRIAEIADELEKEFGDLGLHGYVVICSEQQSPVLQWMGFEVVATYGRPEEFTPGLMHSLVKTGTMRKVRLVADNLQSGPNAGWQLAKDIRAAHVTLSNFPGGYPNTDGWEECLRDNVRRVLAALEKD